MYVVKTSRVASDGSPSVMIEERPSTGTQVTTSGKTVSLLPRKSGSQSGTLTHGGQDSSESVVTDTAVEQTDACAPGENAESTHAEDDKSVYPVAAYTNLTPSEQILINMSETTICTTSDNNAIDNLSAYETVPYTSIASTEDTSNPLDSSTVKEIVFIQQFESDDSQLVVGGHNELQDAVANISDGVGQGDPNNIKNILHVVVNDQTENSDLGKTFQIFPSLSMDQHSVPKNDSRIEIINDTFQVHPLSTMETNTGHTIEKLPLVLPPTQYKLVKKFSAEELKAMGKTKDDILYGYSESSLKRRQMELAKLKAKDQKHIEDKNSTEITENLRTIRDVENSQDEDLNTGDDTVECENHTEPDPMDTDSLNLNNESQNNVILSNKRKRKKSRRLIDMEQDFSPKKRKTVSVKKKKIIDVKESSPGLYGLSESDRKIPESPANNGTNNQDVSDKLSDQTSPLFIPIKVEDECDERGVEPYMEMNYWSNICKCFHYPDRCVIKIAPILQTMIKNRECVIEVEVDDTLNVGLFQKRETVGGLARYSVSVVKPAISEPTNETVESSKSFNTRRQKYRKNKAEQKLLNKNDVSEKPVRVSNRKGNMKKAEKEFQDNDVSAIIDSTDERQSEDEGDIYIDNDEEDYSINTQDEYPSKYEVSPSAPVIFTTKTKIVASTSDNKTPIKTAMSSNTKLIKSKQTGLNSPKHSKSPVKVHVSDTSGQIEWSDSVSNFIEEVVNSHSESTEQIESQHSALRNTDQSEGTSTSTAYTCIENTQSQSSSIEDSANSNANKQKTEKTQKVSNKGQSKRLQSALNSSTGDASLFIKNRDIQPVVVLNRLPEDIESPATGSQQSNKPKKTLIQSFQESVTEIPKPANQSVKTSASWSEQVRKYPRKSMKKSDEPKPMKKYTIKVNEEGIRLFECPICGYTSKYSQNTTKHISDHTAEKNFICDQCGATFRSRHALMSHVVIHQTDRPYPCPLCPQAFKRVKIYCCLLCDYSYKDPSYMKVHHNQHTSERPYQCEVCGMTFKIPSSLYVHRRLHTDKMYYTCEFCQKGFKGLRLIECLECGLVNKCLRNMKIHLHQHTGETPYMCEVCGRTFKGPSNLRSHRKLHSQEMFYTCEFCQKQFKDLGNYKVHLRRHLGDTKHFCGICGKSCFTTSDLKKHARTHTGEKPFECNICGKVFADNSSVARHRNQHTAIHKFECSICQRSFTRRDLCMGHVKRSHPSEVDNVAILKVMLNPDDIDCANRSVTKTTQSIVTPKMLVKNKNNARKNVDRSTYVQNAHTLGDSENISASTGDAQNRLLGNSANRTGEDPITAKPGVLKAEDRLPKTVLNSKKTGRPLQEYSYQMCKADGHGNKTVGNTVDTRRIYPYVSTPLQGNRNANPEVYAIHIPPVLPHPTHTRSIHEPLQSGDAGQKDWKSKLVIVKNE